MKMWNRLWSLAFALSVPAAFVLGAKALTTGSVLDELGVAVALVAFSVGAARIKT